MTLLACKNHALGCPLEILICYRNEFLMSSSVVFSCNDGDMVDIHIQFERLWLFTENICLAGSQFYPNIFIMHNKFVFLMFS